MTLEYHIKNNNKKIGLVKNNKKIKMQKILKKTKKNVMQNKQRNLIECFYKIDF